VKAMAGACSSVLIAVILLASLAPAPAQAAAPQFLGTLEGHFSKPEPTAVDQASGDVYVLDLATASIQKFDSSGRPADFTASEPYVEANELTGTPEGPLAVFNSNSSEAQIAVAPPGAAGGTARDIYVTENATHVISIFAPSGEFLGRLTEAGGAPFPEEPCGVATDPAGDVYVGVFSGEVEKYVPSANPPVNADFDSRLTGLGEICKLASSSATLYASNTYVSGPTQAYPLSLFPGGGGSADATGLGTAIEAEGAPVSTTDLAVDPTDEDLYLDERGQIGVFDSSGNPLESFGSGEIANSQGLAVDPGSGNVYVADAGATPAAVEIFGTPLALKPSVDQTSAADVSTTSTDLRAEINPHTLASQYRFEYITEAGFEANVEAGRDPFLGAARLPGSDAQVPGAGFHDVAVEQHLQGLTPATAYRYRAVATNSLGSTPGPNRRLVSQGSTGAGLPDGRAYEMVSPLEKNHALITGIDGFPTGTVGGVVQSAADGDALAYASNGAFSGALGAPLSNSYLATRGGGTWATSSPLPPIASESYFPIGQGGPYKAFSEDLSQGLFVNGEHKPIENPPLTPDAPPGYQDFYLQPFPGTVFSSVLSGTPAQAPAEFGLSFLDATPDLGHLLFSTTAALTSDAVQGAALSLNLYQWSAGRLQLVNVLPNETSGTPGAVLGADNASIPAGLHPMSADGSRVFFTEHSNLYVREAGSPAAVQVDTAQGGPESGGGVFEFATENGSRVFFTDTRRLTEDSTAASSSGLSDLYEFDPETGDLTDLTTSDPGGADVQRILGASAEGSYVYFVANGLLAPGATHRGSCSIQLSGGGPQTCNLYVWHRGASGGGTTKFIAALSQEDNTEAALEKFIARGSADDWAPGVTERTSRVSADGTNLVFMSQGELTGYQNKPPRPSDCGRMIEAGGSVGFVPKPCQEVYDYDAASEQLSCVSCNPTGALPTGGSSIPGGTDFEVNGADYQSRVLSDSGGSARVFFTSSDALVPADTNGEPDVYEWEQSDRGTCHTEGGCLSLISSGTSASESSFLDASADGDDVFFLTTSSLVSGDTDKLFDVYDARAPHQPGEAVGALAATPTPPPCEGDACQSPAQSPPDPTLATSISSGPAEPNRPRKRHHQRKHHKKAAHRRAGHDRRAPR
jgi:hypothetical protein